MLGDVLILSKESLSDEVRRTLNDNLPEFPVVNVNPSEVTIGDLGKSVVAIGDNDSISLMVQKFKEENLPTTLLVTSGTATPADASLDDVIYDTFNKDDPSAVIYRRIRNALFFAIKSKELEAYERDTGVSQNSKIMRILKESKKLIPLRDTESSIIRIISSAASILNSEGGTFLLADKEKQVFTAFNYQLSRKKGLDGYQEFELEDGIPAWVYKNRQLYICNDPQADNLYSDEFDRRFNKQTKNLIACPLVDNDRVLGILRIYNKDYGGFTEDDGVLLQEICDISTQIILNTHYFENHSNFFTQAVKLLIIALEAHDEYFKLHSDSVTTYVDRMAEVLDMNLEDSLALHFAAIFHDIGKLRIDSKILTKEAPLTQMEKKRLSLHSIAGEELLKGIKIFNNSTKLIRHHHEWYNGSGFPDGLEGEGIPFGSRIIHICEAYDSMTSIYLPQRTPLEKEEACAELRSYSGVQFDPELVEIFITKVLSRLE